jgi:hypothetical protein
MLFRCILLATLGTILAATENTETAEDGGFMSSCNGRTVQMSDHYVGMYCNNEYTTLFGYNWTWYTDPSGRKHFVSAWVMEANVEGRIDMNMCLGDNDGRLMKLRECAHAEKTSLTKTDQKHRAVETTGAGVRAAMSSLKATTQTSP